MSKSLKSVNITLFGKSIFADTIKLRILREDSWFPRLDHKSSNRCPYKREDTHRRGGGQVTMKAETGVMKPQSRSA